MFDHPGGDWHSERGSMTLLFPPPTWRGARHPAACLGHLKKWGSSKRCSLSQAGGQSFQSIWTMGNRWLYKYGIIIMTISATLTPQQFFDNGNNVTRRPQWTNILGEVPGVRIGVEAAPYLTFETNRASMVSKTSHVCWGLFVTLHPWTPKPWKMEVLIPKNMDSTTKKKGNVDSHGKEI